MNWIIKLNNIYNPSWIFCDRGYGDYQLERIHIYGEDHPSTGLKNKVVGWQFKQTIDIINPVTKELVKEPMKPFMVNQLKLSFERDRMILCPFDEILHKQLIDYVVEKITENGMPKYTSKNEHFVDALGLAHLAFVLKFPDLTQAIKSIKNTSKIEHSGVKLGSMNASAALRDISSPVNAWKNSKVKQIGKGPDERPGDYQKWVKVPLRAGTSRNNNDWGRRSGRFEERSLW